MINMLDDCSRVFTGSKIYEREPLLAYLDFLPAAFIEYGLPLEIYVDFHSLFFTHDPQALTQLGRALHFYGTSFRYAPTPQAKGKVERSHFFWQERLAAADTSMNILLQNKKTLTDVTDLSTCTMQREKAHLFDTAIEALFFCFRAMHLTPPHATRAASGREIELKPTISLGEWSHVNSPFLL